MKNITRPIHLHLALLIPFGACGVDTAAEEESLSAFDTDGGQSDDTSGHDGGTGETGPSGAEASIIGAEPRVVFAGRKATVQVAGAGTAWTDGVSVSFGEGITVDGVTVNSPTSLTASLTVSHDAVLGARELVVASGDERLVSASAFTVDPPAVFAEIRGTAAQGSPLILQIKNVDAANPFDLTTVCDPQHLNRCDFKNLKIVAPPGIHVDTSFLDGEELSPTLINAGLMIDVDAVPGPLNLEISSGTDGETILYRLPTIELARREPIALAHGVPLEGSLVGPLGSALYSYFPGERSIVRLDVANPEEGKSAPELVLLGGSGAYVGENVLAFNRGGGAVVDHGVYGIVVDPYSKSESGKFVLSARSAVLGHATATETASLNDTYEEAQEVILPVTVENCEIEYHETLAQHGVDWFRVVLEEGDGNKALAVRTLDPAADDYVYSDPTIDVFAGDGTTLIATGGSPLDVTYHETVMTPPLPPGSYYVRISVGEFAGAAPHPYNLALALSSAAE